MLDALTYRYERISRAVGRTTGTPLLVRAAVFGTALGALLVAYPAQTLATRVVGLLVLAAALPAVAPRGRGAGLVALLAVAGWLIDTGWYDRPVALWRLLTLATLLYLLHSLAALAAALPYDARVAPEVVAGWLARALAVVLGSAVLTVAVLMLTGELRVGTFQAATVLGLAVAVGAAALLARLLRRG